MRPDEDENLNCTVAANLSYSSMRTPSTEELKRLAPHVAEMYSTPRVTKTVEEMGSRAGIACDLTNGWDFRIAAQREKALQYVKDERPWLVIGTPCALCLVCFKTCHPGQVKSNGSGARQ